MQLSSIISTLYTASIGTIDFEIHEYLFPKVSNYRNPKNISVPYPAASKTPIQ